MTSSDARRESRHAMKQVFAIILLGTALWAPTTIVAQAQTQRPNVLVVVVDDAGFMDFGAYGGTAATPAIDAIAARGVKLANYITSPQCGPSRAMLLTGADNHEVGMGSIGEALTPQLRANPAYSLKMMPGTLTLADRLHAAGYQTFATGKWGVGDVGVNLPDAHGFDHSYVMDATGADNWEQKPYLPVYTKVEWFEDGKSVQRPEGVYSSELIVDKTIDYIDAARPDVPYFAYVAFQAIHLPIQAPREYIDRYNGKFDAGWAKIRAGNMARAKQLGLFPKDAPDPTWPQYTRDWDSLSPQKQALMARMMQVNAGMLEAMDFHLGRLIDHLAAKGQLENTIVVVVSDNGPESVFLGDRRGMVLWMMAHGYDTKIENLGEQGSMAGIGKEWAAVGAAPFSRFKFFASEGGQRVPLVIAGPGIPASGFLHARSYLTDLVPTLLDFVGVDQSPGGVSIRGRSLRPVLTGALSEVYGDNDAVGLEVSGNASLYRGQWKISRMPIPLGDAQWHLYDLAADPGETRDLRAENPVLFSDMLNEYQRYASEVGVVDQGPGYNPFKQIRINGIKVQVRHYRMYLVAVVLLLGVAVWRIRRRRSVRTARGPSTK